jgi:serine/threonine protein kinase
VIEKATVDRMKKRHTNIHNEIMMEKRVLNKMNHPNIVTLYSTFQDYGTNYLFKYLSNSLTTYLIY